MDPVSSANRDRKTDCNVSVYSGNEPFFSFFSSAEVALATLRLTLADRCLFQASDLASQLVTLRREFQHNGKFPDAIQDVMRIANQFQVRVQNWEREVQNLERSKLDMSGTRLQKIRVEVSQVRVKIQTTERVLAKLQIVLHQLQAEEAEKRLCASKTADPGSMESIDPEEAESVAAQFQDAIDFFVGQAWVIESKNAALESPLTGLRVQVWDQPLFLAVAQWRIGEPHAIGSNPRLVLWLIPKFKDIAKCATSIARSLRWESLGHGSQQILESQTACPLPDHRSLPLAPDGDGGIDFPQSLSIIQDLDRLISKRFDCERDRLVALHTEIPSQLLLDGRVILKTCSQAFPTSQRASIDRTSVR